MSASQNTNSDEIDLRDLFKYIGNAFHSILQSIINLIGEIRSITLLNIKTFILSITLFLIGAISFYFSINKDVFGSSIVVRSGYLNTQLINNTVNKLEILANEENKSTLAQILNIDISIADQIKGFEVEPFITEEEKLEVELLKEKLLNLKLEEEIVTSISQKIELRNPNTFKITVYTEANSIISTLDSAIVNFFIQNDYIKKRIDINRETLKKRKIKLEKEQLKMDSLKQSIFNVYQSLSKNNSGLGSDNVIMAGQEVTDPLRVFREDININDDILDIERALFLKNEFEVIEGFTPFNKPVSISLPLLIVYTVLAAISFTYLLIMLIAANKFFADREKKLNA